MAMLPPKKDVYFNERLQQDTTSDEIKNELFKFVKRFVYLTLTYVLYTQLLITLHIGTYLLKPWMLLTVTAVCIYTMCHSILAFYILKRRRRLKEKQLYYNHQKEKPFQPILQAYKVVYLLLILIIASEVWGYVLDFIIYSFSHSFHITRF